MGLVSDSPGLGSGLVLILGLMFSDFVKFFGITKFVDEWNQKWFMAMKGPRGAMFMWVRDLGHFVCYCWKNK